MKGKLPFRKWTYDEIAHILDRIGNLRYPHPNVIRDLSVEVDRTVQSIIALHYQWLGFNHAGFSKKSEKWVSKSLRVLFNSYVDVNGEAKFSQRLQEAEKKVGRPKKISLPEPQVDDTSLRLEQHEGLEKSIEDLDSAFESFKGSVLSFIDKAAEQKANDMVKDVQEELVNLRKFKEVASKGKSFVARLRERFMYR